MSIPDFQAIMLPLLKYASDENEHTLRDAISSLSIIFKLNDEEKKELLPSGVQRIFDNRVGWARTYLGKAGLIENTRRGYFVITARGKNVLSEKNERISVAYLNKFDEFLAFRTSHKSKQTNDVIELLSVESNPEELLENAYKQLRDELATELLAQVKANTPDFFEKLVVDVLIAMGYGGSRQEAGKAIGKSGDEGIDGIINEDRLGLDTIYIQAKRWENPVGRPEIQKFVGALQGKRAKKGVFITTSSFSKESHDYVKNIDNKVVLIDGEQLAEYMIDFNVGASKIATYEVKRMDTDYFEEG